MSSTARWRVFCCRQYTPRRARAQAAAIALTDHCGYLHPGDIPHHIYNGNKHYDPTEIMSIWEDDQGVAAWVLVNVNHKSYDAQVRPDLRGNDFERQVLAYADERTVELMRRHDIAGDCLYGDAFRGDTARSELTTLGIGLASRQRNTLCLEPHQNSFC